MCDEIKKVTVGHPGRAIWVSRTMVTKVFSWDGDWRRFMCFSDKGWVHGKIHMAWSIASVNLQLRIRYLDLWAIRYQLMAEQFANYSRNHRNSEMGWILSSSSEVCSLVSTRMDKASNKKMYFISVYVHLPRGQFMGIFLELINNWKSSK